MLRIEFMPMRKNLGRTMLRSAQLKPPAKKVVFSYRMKRQSGSDFCHLRDSLELIPTFPLLNIRIPGRKLFR